MYSEVSVVSVAISSITIHGSFGLLFVFSRCRPRALGGPRTGLIRRAPPLCRPAGCDVIDGIPEVMEVRMPYDVRSASLIRWIHTLLKDGNFVALLEPYIVALASLPKPLSLRRGRYSRSSRGRGACSQSTRVSHCQVQLCISRSSTRTRVHGGSRNTT
ncbi:hypothetical protein SCLCIDRAFT_197118 [Scleroderma citrinum Foug A]|uniref:Uncharacterized protein n=1 Tax=Scleroderma citrinum Foug A TaxID=1036808 RepID=A0A0C3DLC5_9AGAM|nr:hypothetical protein SCLCIDRAFT_197118 [Scleroderma citrinum Foug A]